MEKIAYLIHPVSRERKLEMRGKGFRILDAKFAPKEPGEKDFVEKPKSIQKDTK